MSDHRYTVEKLGYSPPVKVLNQLARLAELLRIPIGALEPQKVLDAARRRSGLEDWGDEQFLEGLHVAMDCARAAPITPLARAFMTQTAITALVNRLQVRSYLNRFPAVRALPIRRPLFILGFPRTGTTVLQNLLSSGERRSLHFWELTNPVPLANDPQVDQTKSIRRTATMIRIACFVAPEMQEAHHIEPTTVEECWPLFTNTFRVMNWDLASRLDSYGAWLLESADMAHAYREYKSQLQVLAHTRGTSAYVLKCPEHLWFLDALLETFPDACIVWTHRDPLASVASYSSLVSLGHRTMMGQIELPTVGAHIADRFHTGVTRAMEARSRHDPARFFDVQFSELVQDPLPIVQKIIDHFQLDLHIGRPEVDAFLAAQREDKLGAHKYSAERFGLVPEEIHERYAPYIRRFDITTGPSGKAGARTGKAGARTGKAGDRTGKAGARTGKAGASS